MDPCRRLHEKIERICLKILNGGFKIIFVEWFFPNNNVDGGVFDWGKYLHVIFYEKLVLFFSSRVIMAYLRYKNKR